MIWTPSDELLSDELEEEMERRVDVTNVILGEGFHNWPFDNGKRGYILTHGDQIPSGGPYAELTVVVWQQRNEMEFPPESGETYTYWDVFFKVYGEYPNGEKIESSLPIQVENPLWLPFEEPGQPYPYAIPGSQTYPAVTAYIEHCGGGDGYLFIDIAYQRMEAFGEYDNRRLVWRTRYHQVAQDNYDAFQFEGVEQIAPDPGEDPFDPDFFAVHPDIVYGTYYWGDFANPVGNAFDGLLIAYEVLDRTTNRRSIRVAEGSRQMPGFPPFGFHEIVFSGSDINIPQRPRIDIGIDCSRHEGARFYITPVVWQNFHPPQPLDPYWKVTIHFAYKVFNVTPPYWEHFGSIDFFECEENPNGLPVVEVDPLENFLENGCLNYTHVVWSRFNDINGMDIEPFYTNSYEVLWDSDNEMTHKVASSGDPNYRDGLPTIATYIDQDAGTGQNVGTIQFISGQIGSPVYPVFSVDFGFIDYDPEQPVFSFPPFEQVSDGGNSSTDQFPWVYGPSSAMLGGDTTVCGWTHKDNYGDQDPEIYADVD